MSDIYLSHCSQCFPGSAKVSRTIRKHLKHGQQFLGGVQGHQPKVTAHIEDCIQKNFKSLKQSNI
jgi:hypothetical protein